MRRWQVDECPDSKGCFTIRHFDGSPNGNILEQPIATVYVRQNALDIVDIHNKELVEQNEREKSCTE